MKRTLPLYLSLLLLTQCKQDDPRPEDQLPPATQTGANTFGCLVNGQPWTPRGNDGTSNFSVVYDPNYAQGWLSVATYRIADGVANQQIISLNSDSMRAVGTYPLRILSKHFATLIDGRSKCKYYPTDATTYCRGNLTITRLDMRAGVVSGTFDFTLAKLGCDTIRITHGRFDKKL